MTICLLLRCTPFILWMVLIKVQARGFKFQVSKGHVTYIYMLYLTVTSAVMTHESYLFPCLLCPLYSTAGVGMDYTPTCLQMTSILHCPWL